MGLSDLPLARADRHVRAFQALGWLVAERTRGRNPHIILTKQGCRNTLAIPNHKGRDVKRPLLAKLLKAAGVSEAEYLAVFKK